MKAHDPRAAGLTAGAAAAMSRSTGGAHGGSSQKTDTSENGAGDFAPAETSLSPRGGESIAKRDAVTALMEAENESLAIKVTAKKVEVNKLTAESEAKERAAKTQRKNEEHAANLQEKREAHEMTLEERRAAIPQQNWAMAQQEQQLFNNSVVTSEAKMSVLRLRRVTCDCLADVADKTRSATCVSQLGVLFEFSHTSASTIYHTSNFCCPKINRVF